MPATTTVGDQKVGSVGYGLMGTIHAGLSERHGSLQPGLTWHNAATSDEKKFAAMRASLDAGCNYWNGGIFYGPPDDNSLVLLSKYYAKYPEDAKKVVLNIKGGIENMTANSSPAFMRAEIESSLKTLGGKGRIDQYECARRDPKVPLKESLGALAEMVKEGKIGGVALSEVNANTIKEAAAITKIVAVEVELSLWSTEPLTNGIAKVCSEEGIAIIA